MAIEVDREDAPAHWASYLVNGDASGFDYYNTPNDKAGDRDKAECDRWTARLAVCGWYVVCTEGEESHYGRWNGLLTELRTYVLHRTPERG